MWLKPSTTLPATFTVPCPPYTAALGSLTATDVSFDRNGTRGLCYKRAATPYHERMSFMTSASLRLQPALLAVVLLAACGGTAPASAPASSPAAAPPSAAAASKPASAS